MNDVGAQLAKMMAEIERYKRGRFWVLLNIQMYMGVLLVVLDQNQYVSQSYLLDQLGFTHRYYGLCYLVGGVALLYCRHKGSQWLRVAHAIVAGFFALTAIILFTGLLTNHEANSITWPLYFLAAWEHMKAGQSQQPITVRRDGNHT